MKRNLTLNLLLFFSIFRITASDVFSEEKSKVSPTPTVSLWVDFKGPRQDDPRIVGKSFTFKGRASYLNGNITSLKIWIIGTHRLLGVLTAGCMPANLQAGLKDDLDASIYGMFTVYPLTRFKKGEMQFVCIDSVKITEVIKSKPKKIRKAGQSGN